MRGRIVERELSKVRSIRTTIRPLMLFTSILLLFLLLNH